MNKRVDGSWEIYQEKKNLRLPVTSLKTGSFANSSADKAWMFKENTFLSP